MLHSAWRDNITCAVTAFCQQNVLVAGPMTYVLGDRQHLRVFFMPCVWTRGPGAHHSQDIAAHVLFRTLQTQLPLVQGCNCKPAGCLERPSQPVHYSVCAVQKAVCIAAAHAPEAAGAYCSQYTAAAQARAVETFQRPITASTHCSCAMQMHACTAAANASLISDWKATLAHHSQNIASLCAMYANYAHG